MTSNDVPVPAGGSAGRRRVLGRGPGAAPAPVVEPVVPPAGAEPEAAAPAAEPEPPAAEGESRVEVVAPAAEGESRVEVVAPAAEGESRVEVVAPAAEGESRVEVVAPAADGGSSCPPSPELSAPLERDLPVSFEQDLSASLGQGEPPSPSGTAAHNADGGFAAPSAPEPEEPGDGVFKVRLSNFEGPFDLLLQLISKHKLDVTEVALSKVTDEFMAHIRAMGPDWDLDQTTEFLVVAATLLDLKAARLLPSAEVEDEADLALLEARDLLFARLLQYRAYKQIADIFNARLEEEGRRYPRTVGLEAHHAELLPEVVISIGAEGFAKLAVKAMQPRPKPQVYVDHIHAPLVSVQEQAGIVVARLRELGEASFRALVEDTDDTLTVVARFLALLELYREKVVALDQEEALGDLVVRWTGGDGDEQPTVTDEFDRPPEEPEDDAKKEKA
ncbi:segregation/condensation protein A [Streptomyces sp. NBC_00996]|uniref:segregation/condensation protein A n=1 Tax=Streptomyces sp. NBC_00996 TaxID=2903710 RepID=UPI0038676501|nr:segregation/condensation protein A [Streptomyces sp. NBC_00996]